jgi:hypothetical protein
MITLIIFTLSVGNFKDKKEEVATLVKSTAKSISLVIADTNYGVAKGGGISSEFDRPNDRWAVVEFEEAIRLVINASGSLENTRWVFFVSSKQLGDVLTVLTSHDMDFKLLTWSKETSKPVLGLSWRHNAEHILFCWAKVGESEAERFVVPCPADPERYLTNFSAPPVAKPFIFEGAVLNAYQKPVSVMRRILDLAPPDEGVVVDLTCGSGSTLVRTPSYH